MSNTPKIMVFKLKELIYTGIFILLGLLLLIFLIKMFKSDKNENSDSTTTQPTQITSESSTDSLNESTPSKTTTMENDETTNVPETEATSSEAITNESTKSTQTQEASNGNAINTNASGNYSPGVYTSSLVLNNSALEVEVCVDLDSINSISIKNMDEAITTMYPLMSDSIEDLENQIVNSQSLDNITYTSENRYTYMVLLDAINHALSKAKG